MSGLIKKHNTFLNSTYRIGLVEAKIILKLISMIHRNDTEFREYFFSVKELLKEFHLGARNHNEIVKATENLVGKVATIPIETGFMQVTLLSSAIYHQVGEHQGKVQLRFDPVLKPFLLHLKDNFTTFWLRNIIQLKSIYSIRIYEFLKQFTTLGERKMSIDEIRKKLELKPIEYMLYSNFKNRVILPAQKELKKKTDISFEFKEIKQGRRVDSIHFKIFPNEKEAIPINLFEQRIFEKIKKVVQLPEARMRQILETHGEEKIEIALEYTKKKSKKSREGYFVILLDDPYFGEKEMEEKRKKKLREEKKEQERIREMEEELKRKEEDEKVKKFIKENPEEYKKLEEEYFKTEDGIRMKEIKEKGGFAPSTSLDVLSKSHARNKIRKKLGIST